MNTDLGFDLTRLERVKGLCRAAVERGEIPALALAVARQGRLIVNEAWGEVRMREEELDAQGLPRQSDPVKAGTDTLWLIASVTKPVVCAGICLLLERGLLGLDDPVAMHLPEFQGDDRRNTRLLHLLTHSSGLPDMLPENTDLRKRHAPMDEFVRLTCTTPLLFAPGTGVSYQSKGILLLAEILERVTGESCRDFLRRELFLPLGLSHTALGWRPEFAGKTAVAHLEPSTPSTNWDWNSRYWREFGAPWGGMFATAAEFAILMQMLQARGLWEGHRFFGPATVRAMTRNQTADLPDLSATDRRRSTWGLGWRVAAGRESEYMGDLLHATAYGHGGATGTGVWNDPTTGVSFVLFSNRPGCGRFIGRVSNAVAAATIA